MILVSIGVPLEEDINRNRYKPLRGMDLKCESGGREHLSISGRGSLASVRRSNIFVVAREWGKSHRCFPYFPTKVSN